jgi:hypothetical protein
MRRSESQAAPESTHVALRALRTLDRPGPERRDQPRETRRSHGRREWPEDPKRAVASPQRTEHPCKTRPRRAVGRPRIRQPTRASDRNRLRATRGCVKTNTDISRNGVRRCARPTARASGPTAGSRSRARGPQPTPLGRARDRMGQAACADQPPGTWPGAGQLLVPPDVRAVDRLADDWFRLGSAIEPNANRRPRRARQIQHRDLVDLQGSVSGKLMVLLVVRPLRRLVGGRTIQVHFVEVQARRHATPPAGPGAELRWCSCSSQRFPEVTVVH